MQFSKLFRYLLFILLNISFCVIYPQWEVQNTHTKSLIYKLFFLDSLNGWAVTDSSFYLKTTDGGNNWAIEKFNVDELDVEQIQFVSKDIGYACGSLGRLLSTKDGGKSWQLYPYAFEIEFWDLSFINENEGWAVGERYGENWGRGMIVHTSDGGTTWHKQLELESSDPLKVNFFRSVRMKNNKEGWALASDYFDNFSPTYVFKTLDGGITWTKLNSPIQGIVRRLKVANNDTLWTDGYGVGPMSVSINGGKTWETYIDNQYRYISAISPFSGNEGWACSVDIYRRDPNIILYTTDRGLTWKEDLHVNERVLDIENKGNFVWIAGRNGLIMRNKLIPSSVYEDKNATLTSFELYPNYPNPFNSQTTITYSVPSVANIEIDIYNSLGQIISSFYFPEKRIGKHKLVWNTLNQFGDPVSSGIYFYRIVASMQNGIKQQRASKMLLVE